VAQVEEVDFALGFPNLTVETFDETQQKLFCDKLVATTSFPPGECFLCLLF